MHIPPETLEWLLEPGEPAVRYRTLVDLLERGRDDAEARAAREDIPRRGWAAELFRTQKPEGHWESRRDLYRPKYSATIWKFLVLSDLGVTAADPRMRRTCELFLTEYARPDGGLDSPGASPSELCLTGNLARALLRGGYIEDRRVQSALEWIVRTQMGDGGWHCFVRIAFGRGTLDAWEGLNALAHLPQARWTPQIRRSAEAGAEFYLGHGLLRQGKERYLPWYRAHYPVHYYYDFLVGLDMVTRLGYGGDRRLRPALELLESKRRADGRWTLERVHPDLGAGAGYRMPRTTKRFALEKQGQPSKWITLTALQVLKRVEESAGR